MFPMQHLNSDSLCRATFYATALLLSGLLMSSAAVASELCQLPDSDTDNDGWGWENGASCIVDSSLLREAPPVCEQPASDPDNDGWGWENNASCVVETVGSGTAPATDIAAAATAAIGETLSATLSEDEPMHWYAFDVVNADYAFTLTASNATREQYFYATLENSNGTEQAYWSIDIGASENMLCLTPGRYFFSVNWSGFPDEISTYELALSRTELRCESPEYTFETSSTDAFTTTADGYAYLRPDNTLAAVSSTGQQLWTLALDFDYVDFIESVGNTLYVSNSQRIHAVSATGDRLWTYPDDDRNLYLQSLVATENAVYVAHSSGLVALDLNGREQWLLPTPSGVRDIEIGADGTVYVQGYDSVSVIRP
jgi:hypothetical protein